nr:hypothetical protein [Vagococcus fluvialis]
MVVLMIEKIQQKGNEVRLFSKNKYYFVNNQWTRYVEKLVNGKPKRTNQIMCIKDLSNIYHEIQSVWNADGVLIASRKTKADILKWVNESSELALTNDKSQFMRPVSLVVKKLTPSEKVSLRAMLARDQVTYCEFEDTKELTKIRTSSKGYRLISLIV